MEQMDTKWSVKGKHVIITGGTSGIGLAASKELAIRGAHLGIVARNHSKANELADQLKAISKHNITVDIFVADMSSQQSIRQAAATILSSWPTIDILINNAGAMFVTRKLTVDDIEKTWAINHLAPFLLTNLLLERLKENKHARIITTASHGHKMAKKGIRFDDLSAVGLYSFPQSLMGGANFRYGETKLANIMFTAELGRRLEGTGIKASCYDPGLVATNFNQDNGWLARLTMAVMKWFSRTPEKGAETLIWLADSNGLSIINGSYYKDRKSILPSEPAQNKVAAKRLWEISQEQILERNLKEKF